MYHGGRYPAEEERFVQKMYDGRHRFHGAFDVTCGDGLNVVETCHGRFENTALFIFGDLAGMI